METITSPNGGGGGGGRCNQQPQNIDIEFQDLTYSVRGTNADPRHILKNISGYFRAGDLTAMMGPSGAGKSTLMNILAGYVSSGVTGVIKTNDYARDIKQFHRVSAYIMQEDLLQPNLTVREAMTIAANLKLGDEYSQQQKIATVSEVLDTLGLTRCCETRCEALSGGQRKRLSVALELVNNPTVIFLDEPTSGLDVVSTKQCVTLLQTLARQGRTVVCTIHQPTASIFKMFDQVYCLAKGRCIYNGSTSLLVPFLSTVGLTCPTTYNPADYIIELVQPNDDHIKILSSSVQNGRINQREHKERYVCDDSSPQLPTSYAHGTFPTSFWSQFTILLGRMLLQTSRNKTMLCIQLLHHLISGFLIGSIFFMKGNDAFFAITNFKFCLSSLVFFMYTHIMIPILIFPAEVKLLRREYFNRWYGLKAFYAARTVSTIPLLVVFSLPFLMICYIMTDQPWDLVRFGWFSLFGLLVGFCSEGLGLAVGSACSITNGSIVGPASITPILALCVYGMGYGTAVEPLMSFLMTLSYLRYGLVGLTESIYGLNRTALACTDDLYCHYNDPAVLMRDLGMSGVHMTSQIAGLLVFILLYRVIGYLTLRYRLTAEFSNKIMNYAAKVLRHK